MEIKTCIIELNTMITSTIQCINSFQYNELALESESVFYELMLLETTEQAKEEINKAKELLKNGNNNRA